MRRKLILDLDTGIDDALAIAYAVGSADKADLIGITATYGNVSVPLAARNALAVLHLFGRDDVPVYPGVDHPLAPETLPGVGPVGEEERSASYARWQAGGRGRLAWRRALGRNRELQARPSPQWPRRCSDSRFAALAGETGVGRRFHHRCDAQVRPRSDDRGHRRDDDDGDRVPRRPGSQGLGRERHADGRGADPARQCEPGAEANISQDPEAADYLFRCGARTTMIGLDATHQTSLTRSQAHEWKALGIRAGDFLVTMTDYYIDFYLSHQPEIHGCGLHDPLAVAAALDPSLVTTFRFDLQVDLEGALRGRTIGDRSRWQEPDKHTRVALGVDVPGSSTGSWPASPAPQRRHATEDGRSGVIRSSRSAAPVA